MKPSTEKGIILSVHCPALNATVRLKETTWTYKILPGHPLMRNKLHLVKETIEKCDSVDKLYQKVRNLSKISTQMKCSDFLPANPYVRVAMQLKDDGTAVVTSAYPVHSFPKEGVKKYESRS